MGRHSCRCLRRIKSRVGRTFRSTVTALAIVFAWVAICALEVVPVRGVRRWGASLLMACCVSWALPAQAAPDVLEGPSEVEADGSTRATFSWSSSRDVSGVSATLSAGRVLAVRRVGSDIEVEVRAPRLVESHEALLQIEDERARVLARRRIVFVRTPPTPQIRTSPGVYELAGPERLVLGLHDHAYVTFRAEAADAVELYSNVGRFEAVVDQGDGTFRARYLPPVEKYPQVAIVAAMGRTRGDVDWIAIPLYGRPEVTTRSDPLSVVFVDVAQQRHGPLLTDRRGEARVRVWVPPGVQRANTVVRDALGNQRTARLDLKVPDFSRQLVACSEATPLVTVVAVDPLGQALPVPDFSVRTSLGEVTQLTKRVAGVFDLGVRVPDDAEKGASVRIHTVPEDGGRGAACDTEVMGELPRAVRLTASRTEYVAGGSPIEIKADLEYAGRREPGEVKLRFSASSGEVLDLRKLSNTEYRARYRPSDAFGDVASATVSVRVEGLELSDEARVTLRPGAPTAVALELRRPRLRADGASSSDLWVEVRDLGGNLTDVAPPTARAVGRVSEFRRKAVGQYVATYTAPASSRSFSDRVVVSAGDARGSEDADLQALDRPLVASARAGYFTNFGRVSALTLSATGAMRMPFEERLAVGVSVGYYQYDEEDVGGDLGAVRIGVTSLPMTLQVVYEQPLGMFVPYVGAGGGLVVNWTQLSGELVDRQSVVARPMAALMAGVTLPLRSETTLLGGLTAQLQYARATVDNGTVTGNLGGLDVTAGYQFDF